MTITNPAPVDQAPTLVDDAADQLERQIHARAELRLMAATVDELPDLAALLTRRPGWHANAACRGVGTDQFFIERGGDSRPAKALCGGCPVRAQCADQGVAGHEKGVWGGMSEKDRRRARRDEQTRC